MKFLCICARGNSRSVALAWILKDLLRQEAIAMGMEAASEPTKAMLYDWADIIILVDQQYAPLIPEQHHPKTRLWHVGGDRFFRSFEPELLNLYGDFIYASGLAPHLVFTEEQRGITQVRAEDPEGRFPKAKVVA